MEIRRLESGRVYIKFKNGVEWLMPEAEAKELVEKLTEVLKEKE